MVRKKNSHSVKRASSSECRNCRAKYLSGGLRRDIRQVRCRTVIPALQLKGRPPWTLLLSCRTESGILDRQKNQICIGLSVLLPIPFIGAVPRSCFINGL